jgi:hypothetical protein
MVTATPDPHHHENAFRGFDESAERVLGADMRLIYGMAAPILMIVGLIVILALSPGVWLLATIMLLELALLGVVVYGFTGLLNEPENEDDRP